MGKESFSIEIGGVPVDLPTEERSRWTVREILGLASENQDFVMKCPGPSCFIALPKGAGITIPSDDPLDITLSAPAKDG
ncbi:hypothetical protein LUW75_01285 [Streptomyces sp. MRC013]|uniref:hypothetical protein n=1 Tax=Streptomyces sp. MRC013 TaxID=2898276 RepID=UPI00202683DF|nr:hypothetical protein [Streptomyces sp. MRC013]URM88877.1 hypothetical protein LUW75_01285 [Streptomyces sp. MRC013]